GGESRRMSAARTAWCVPASDRNAAARAERWRKRRHGGAASGAEAGRVVERQRVPAGLTVGREQEVGDQAEPALHLERGASCGSPIADATPARGGQMKNFVMGAVLGI